MHHWSELRDECGAAYAASIVGIHPPMILPWEIAFRRTWLIDHLAHQPDDVHQEIEEWLAEEERAQDDMESTERAALLLTQKYVILHNSPTGDAQVASIQVPGQLRPHTRSDRKRSHSPTKCAVMIVVVGPEPRRGGELSLYSYVFCI